MIVVDTNVIAYLVIDARQDVRRLLHVDRDWVAPRLWRSEFQNVLAVLMRSGRIDLARAVGFLEVARELMDGGECDVPGGRVLPLARESGCSAYDCEFVALAGDLTAPLVTADRGIRQAFPDLALSPAQFLDRRSRP